MTTHLFHRLAAITSGLGSSVVPILISLAAFGFEIYMLIDAIRNPIKNKALWIIIIILFGFIGAVIYNFVGRDKFDSPSAPGL